MQFFGSPENQLKAIGLQLDHDLFPRVLNGGVVVPNDISVHPTTMGTEKLNVFRSATRSTEAGPRRRAPKWQAPTASPWPAGKTSPVIGRSIQELYRDELSAVVEAYPRTQLWHREDGIWIRSRSALLEGLRQDAIFVVGIPFAWPMVRSWGFWGDPIFPPQWIGPRHTNFFDGSICAFEPADGTWTVGESLVSLFDLYTVWALRHLHLMMFGRWPGRQSIHFDIERIIEMKESEICTCGRGARLYENCCKPRDIDRCQVADAVQFILSPRRPPQEILRFVSNGGVPPTLAGILPY